MMQAPVEIRFNRSERVLYVTFDDGTHALSAEYLRVESPSAEVQGHGPEQRVLVAGKRDVSISAIEPVGNYAVRLVFDDGHDTGIFSWDVLHTLAVEHDERWAAYVNRLAAADKTRERDRFR